MINNYTHTIPHPLAQLFRQPYRHRRLQIVWRASIQQRTHMVANNFLNVAAAAICDPDRRFKKASNSIEGQPFPLGVARHFAN